MLFKCPGQDDRNLKSKILQCSHCGYGVEIFSDEIKVKCPTCNAFVYQVKLPSCVDWCRSSKECAGEERYSLE